MKMTQLNKEEAIMLSKTNFWEKLNYSDRFKFQLFQNRLCMPFDIFHEAAEKTLGRPIWTHEFADRDRLRNEFIGKCVDIEVHYENN
jgi:hypothetical protein